MTETRLMGMADGSVATQTLVDGEWMFEAVISPMNAAIDDGALKHRDPPKPRRGRPPKLSA